MNIFKKLMGSDGGADEKVRASRVEANEIKRQIEIDGQRTRNHMDTIDKRTNVKLNRISADLKSVTYRLAIAQGGKKRGL